MKWFKEVIDKTPEMYTYPDTLTGAKKLKRGAGHHHLTGPIYVNGAEPGDILQVEILEPKGRWIQIHPTQPQQ